MRLSKGNSERPRRGGMRHWAKTAWVLLFGMGAAIQEVRSAEARVVSFSGCCDASAGVALNQELIAVASDEDNLLRVYSREAGGAPVALLRVGGAGSADPGKLEMDLEGAARLGDVVYWIGSHSRNSDGKPRPARETLFATRITGQGRSARLERMGQVYHGLNGALAANPELKPFQLSRATTRAGEAQGGLNIEALGDAGGDALWIGFRNPVPQGRALLVRLENPREVVEGKPPRLGKPVLLPLGGLGLRDMLRVGEEVLLLAGPAEGGGRHRLFVWAEGANAPKEIPGAVPKGFQAESIVAVPGSGNRLVDLLSDDGGEKTRGVRCEDLPNAAQRTFRLVRTAY